MKEIPLVVNLKKLTVELSEAKKVSPDAEVGDALIAKSLRSSETGEYVDVKLLVVPDGGYLN